MVLAVNTTGHFVCICVKRAANVFGNDNAELTKM